ncbi:fimbrial protein [Caballeronia insecticola]|uniref:Major type 1 subunit fimbrin n=1 Tax=Caballeronia insecticola TaxID=758793 RepID=R4WZX4_9BURK|nr:fimbrial protein [Caballeronia insecticola]BAN25156.1 major type 1 subunit fimbrin [Caballeronia insecticola]
MKSFAISAVAAAALGLVSAGAHADSGTIQFNGELIAGTCDTDVDGGGSADGTVKLPAVQTRDLTGASGKITGGDTSYKVILKNCTAITGFSKALVFYQAGATVDPVDGRLIVQPGGAENVKIELLNQDGTQIKAGYATDLQNSKAVDISSGGATLWYIARYYATGQTTAGAANSSVVYSVAYQ